MRFLGFISIVILLFMIGCKKKTPSYEWQPLISTLGKPITVANFQVLVRTDKITRISADTLMFWIKEIPIIGKNRQWIQTDDFERLMNPGHDSEEVYSRIEQWIIDDKRSRQKKKHIIFYGKEERIIKQSDESDQKMYWSNWNDIVPDSYVDNIALAVNGLVKK